MFLTLKKMLQNLILFIKKLGKLGSSSQFKIFLLINPDSAMFSEQNDTKHNQSRGGGAR